MAKEEETEAETVPSAGTLPQLETPPTPKTAVAAIDATGTFTGTRSPVRTATAPAIDPVTKKIAARTERAIDPPRPERAARLWIAAFLLFSSGAALLAAAARAHWLDDRFSARATEPSIADRPILVPDHPATWAFRVWRMPSPQAPAEPASPAAKKPAKRAASPRERPDQPQPSVATPAEPPVVERAGIGRANIVVRSGGRSIPMVVYVDGRASDEAPLQLDLPSGAHTIEVRPQNGAPISKRVVIRADETERVVLDVE